MNGKPERPDCGAVESEITARLAEIGVPNPVTGPVRWRKLSEMPEIQEAARMSGPDIQYFATSGMWVKPERAVRVDVVAAGGDGGNAVECADGPAGGEGGGASHIGYQANPNACASYTGIRGSASGGDPGMLSVSSFDAADLPDTIEVTVGKGGRPGGRDGYALIVTHLAGDGAPADPATPLGFIQASINLNIEHLKYGDGE